MKTRIRVVGAWDGRMPSPFEYRPGYEFVNSGTDYDWLIVYDELPAPLALSCGKARTILMTSEPVSIKHYSRAYANQFGHLLTNRPPGAERHPHYHLGRGYYRWFVGRTLPEALETVIPPKSRTISAVCSSKQMRLTRHRDRYRLIETMAREIPDMDWYGHGVRAFGEKHEVTDPYKYQVVVENHIAPHHWTEKLTDAFLSECLPFYAGAPDVADDFPEDSYIPIPIDAPMEAVRIVKSAIAAGEYEKRREAVLEAKRLVLEEYNFYAQAISVIESARGQGGQEPDLRHPCWLYPRRYIRRHSLVTAAEDAWFHLCQYCGCRRFLV